MKALPTIVFCVLSVMILRVSGSDRPVKVPEYPGQPKINAALKQLTEAQTVMTKGGSQDDVIAHLTNAHNAMEGAALNKGSYRVTAIRLTGQAIKHLEKGEKDTAVHEIAEALDAVDKAGQAGAK
jgi:hypothetical protein